MTTPPAAPENPVTPVTIEEEMRRSYLDYAMSVIVARALPDVRDGLKPVQRRILFTMKEAGYTSDKPFRKSARIVGDVMGKYHPHGDSAIYDAMVRMAQDFSMRLMLIQGQGNFGSMDGDPAAAMRYTEARLAKAAEALLEDIDRETVDFQPSYDDSGIEPSVLPAQWPNLLVNGAGGIAVGMATNIPPHNLGEVIEACLAYIDDPEITVDQLIEHVQGPDFPTGGIIMGRGSIRLAYHTGRGSIVMRGRATIEEIRKDREAIVITEVPYQVNKARMIERMAEIVQEKIVDGIADLRDESDRHGVRVVVELKRDAMAEVVLNQLYRYTPLQSTFGVNMLALAGGRPELMGLKDIVAAFVKFREEIITRRTVFELGKARERAHILVGLAIAVANLDPVIAAIRKAKDPADARAALTGTPWPAKDIAPLIQLIDEPGRAVVDGQYRLSDEQAKAILDLRLHRLTGLERDKIAGELKEVVAQIADYLAILGSRAKLLDVLRKELRDMKEKFDTPRRTEIQELEVEQDIEDLIQREDMVVTVTHGGYVKRVPLSAYRAQRRGGKGRAAMATREEDFVSRLFVASTHTPVLFFSSRGTVYKMKVYKLPLGTPQARGKALVNLLPLAEGETITTLMPLPEDETSWDALDVAFATASGHVRRNKLSDFVDVKANGKIAMKLEEGDSLIAAQTATERDDVLLASKLGKSIRFALDEVRVFKGRDSVGVRGISLAKGDQVISMTILRHFDFETDERDAYLRLAALKRREAGNGDETANGDEGIEESAAPAKALSEARVAEFAAAEDFILTVSSSGFGKRSSAYEYRITGRGGKGIDAIDLGRGKDANLVAAFPVVPSDQIMLVTEGGQLIRCPVHDIRIAGRATRGVTLFRISEGERVVSVIRLTEVAGNGANGAHADGEAGEDEGDGASAEDESPDEPGGNGSGAPGDGNDA
ncbi:MAG TPA: DNA gyrase subunit A [Alphaproteobacteria bacterium]|nr:DNA gyrase subunit A [Alphaproteobacteria bacterium]